MLNQAAWTRVVGEIEAFQRDVRDLRVYPRVRPEEIRSELQQRYDFQKPMPIEEVTEDAIRGSPEKTDV